MSHVFLSHGSEDRAEATQLCAFIEARGVQVWMAPRDVRPGMDYSEELQRAIEGSIAFVALVTDTANTSPYVRAETEMAFSSHKPIFPVRLADVKPAAGLAFFLKIRHWTDAFGAAREANLDGLARELQALAGAGAPSTEAVEQPVPPTPAPTTPNKPVATPAVVDELLVAAIGSNSDYYLRRWAQMDETGKAYNWNWAACFVNFGWFAYRKMWLAAVLIGLVYIVTTPLLDPANKPLFRITAFIVIGLSFVTGGFGNKLYRNQVERLVAATKGMGREEAIQQLRRQGGPSVPGMIGSLLGIFLLSGVVTLALAMPKTVPSAPAPGQSATPPAADNGLPTTPVLDRDYLVGRWSDSGDCNQAFELTADGRFISAEGAVGAWRLDGDELTASGPGGSRGIRISPIDQNTMTIVGPDGQTSNPIRC